MREGSLFSYGEEGITVEDHPPLPSSHFSSVIVIPGVGTESLPDDSSECNRSGLRHSGVPSLVLTRLVGEESKKGCDSTDKDDLIGYDDVDWFGRTRRNSGRSGVREGCWVDERSHKNTGNKRCRGTGERC